MRGRVIDLALLPHRLRTEKSFGRAYSQGPLAAKRHIIRFKRGSLTGSSDGE